LKRPKKKKPQRNAALTQKRILDAAEAEFAAKGFDGARLGAIARRAGVQQALIHHHFPGKGGLYHSVMDRALSAMTSEGWDILARTVSSVSAHKSTGSFEGLRETELRPLISAFIELLQRFFTAHAAMLSIVQAEARGARKKRSVALELVRVRVKPVADATTAYLETLRSVGAIRRDVDPQQLCTAAISMVAFPLLEAGFLSAVWPVADLNKQVAIRDDIVEMLVRRVIPR
jgi:AcrR family transcriptional regulator